MHVGTNNIGNRDRFEGIISDYANLIAILRRCKPGIRIVVSSVLPRSAGHSITDKMIKNVSRHLKDVMSKHLNFAFVCSYKAVVKEGTYRKYLFSEKDNGLHLNTEGSNRLRFFFLRFISTID